MSDISVRSADVANAYINVLTAAEVKYEEFAAVCTGHSTRDQASRLMILSEVHSLQSFAWRLLAAFSLLPQAESGRAAGIVGDFQDSILFAGAWREASESSLFYSEKFVCGHMEDLPSCLERVQYLTRLINGFGTGEMLLLMLTRKHKLITSAEDAKGQMEYLKCRICPDLWEHTIITRMKVTPESLRLAALIGYAKGQFHKLQLLLSCFDNGQAWTEADFGPVPAMIRRVAGGQALDVCNRDGLTRPALNLFTVTQAQILMAELEEVMQRAAHLETLCEA